MTLAIQIIFLLFLLWVIFWQGSLLIASIFFAPTVYAWEGAITDALTLAKLKPGETLIDLGCGNARSLILGAKKFGTKGIGVENSLYCIIKSRINITLAGQSQNIKIVFGDFKKVEQDLKKADVVYLYLLNKTLKHIEPWFFSTIGKDTRVVNLAFTFVNHKPIDSALTRNLYKSTMVYLYKK